MKEKAFKILKYLPFIICTALVVCYLIFGRDISADTILNYAPKNQLLAAIFLILLYGIKSLSVFFPIVVLNVAGGFLFSPFIALTVNSLGIIVELAVPYYIGKLSDSNFSKRLSEKYPKIREILERQHGSPLFICFFLRVIACLPGDAVSMYLGAKKTPFKSYMLGSFLGTMPSAVTATLFGTGITEPLSPMFWISIALTVCISLVSIVFYRIRIKRKRNV